ncbi:unnamed protein product [Pleuronectes platessa]|uniref:Uncharacterized protein n=1 Tax=Pleuronectes platessa TaxID=8262 RepID=A0A9N7W1Q4_PLEPL|nr:unnamed protein product [Pleuronectes platessa]
MQELSPETETTALTTKLASLPVLCLVILVFPSLSKAENCHVESTDLGTHTETTIPPGPPWHREERQEEQMQDTAEQRQATNNNEQQSSGESITGAHAAFEIYRERQRGRKRKRAAAAAAARPALFGGITPCVSVAERDMPAEDRGPPRPPRVPEGVMPSQCYS